MLSIDKFANLCPFPFISLLLLLQKSDSVQCSTKPSMESPSSRRPLEMIFLPYIVPSHLIPLCEIARLFAARGERVTIVTTPANASVIQSSISNDVAAAPNIALHRLPFPSREVGLPQGVENTFGVKDLQTSKKLFDAMVLLRPTMEDYIVSRRPDCVVSDMFYPWTADVAARLGVPRLVFHGSCIFGHSCIEAIGSPNSPHLNVESDYEAFVIPGLPDPITITRSQLPDYVRTPYGFTQLMEQFREAEAKSYGVLINNFYEMEPAYTQYYQKVFGHKVFHIGPVALIHRNAREKVERGHKTVVGEEECLAFLNSRKPSSVLYACFGSNWVFTDDQLMEMACGLEASGHQFIWVVFGKENGEDENEKEKWLPKGFEERTKERGMIVRGWAPQTMILDHPSVGGFMSHCGWNSIIEAICAGLPMVTWPLYAEQFYNEKLLTQVLGIGVEVGNLEWHLWVDSGKQLIRREQVEGAVRKLLESGDPAAETMRRKAKELGEMARKAVREGGSSHRNLTRVIEELKQQRDYRIHGGVA